MRSGLIVLACLICLAPAIPAASAREAHSLVPAPADQQLARDIFRGLIEINTTHQFGTTKAALAIQEWLSRAGYGADDMTFVAPPEHPNSGNLIVRLRGKPKPSALAPILFLGHMDVVDAKAEDWSTDPFKFTERDGFYYGRGTIDMKNGDAALVESLIRLKREHYLPGRDIIVAFTADEEAGGDANGPAYLLKEHRELIEAGMVINLDGGGGTTKAGKRRAFELGTSEKNYVTFSFETISAGGHGSLPGADNAIYHLGQALARLEAAKFPVTLTATTRASFAKLASLESGQVAADMRAVSQTPTDTAAAERLSQDPWSNAQLRTTCVATLISGGHAENALPQRAKATIQCRMLPGDDEVRVQAFLTDVVHDPGVKITLDAKPIISPESPPTAKILEQMTVLTYSMWPGVPIIPSMATGFSDDRQTRNAGMPSYDISGIFMQVGENRAHGRDERIGVQAFDESVEFTYRLIKSMGNSH